MNYSKKSYKIASLSNPLIKEAVKVKKRRERDTGLLFIEGFNLIESAFFSRLASIKIIFITDTIVSSEKTQKFLQLILPDKICIVTKKVFSYLVDTETPQGIAAIVDYKLIRLSDIRPSITTLLVVCDAIRDPGNLGTIIRASDAFQADAVAVLPYSSDPFNPKTVRSTAGSLFNIPVVRAQQDELFDYLEQMNITIYVTSPYAQKPINRADMTGPFAIVFGNETEGVNKALLKRASDTLKIPILGKTESLNVAMSAVICLYEAARQRKSH